LVRNYRNKRNSVLCLGGILLLVGVRPTYPQPGDEMALIERPPAAAVHTISWTIKDPVLGWVPGPRLPENATVVRVSGLVTGEEGYNCTFNIDYRFIPIYGGVTILSDDLTVGLGGNTTEVIANSDLSKGAWLFLNITDIVGPPTYLHVTLHVTY